MKEEKFIIYLTCKGEVFDWVLGGEVSVSELELRYCCFLLQKYKNYHYLLQKIMFYF